MRSVSQSLKTALAESWKMQQIEKERSRWDHKRKGHQFHWQWRLIFKLHTKKLFQEHLTCVNLVSQIIPYVGQREHLEIPLTEFILRLFLSSFSLDFFFILSLSISPSISLMRNCCCSLPSPLPPPVCCQPFHLAFSALAFTRAEFSDSLLAISLCWWLR